MPPSRSMSAAATTPSGSTSASAGTISQRAPPTKAVPIRTSPVTTASEAITTPPAQGSREADAQGRAGDGDGEEGGEEDPPRGAGRVVGCRSAESAPEQEAGQPDHGDDEQAGAEEEERSAEKRHQRDPQHDGAGHRGRLARAARARLAVGRHEGEQQQVGEHADAAGEGEHDEADAEQQRVDVEVAAEPGGDAADDGVRAGAGQAPRRLGSGSLGRSLVGHGMNCRASASAFPLGMTLTRPGSSPLPSDVSHGEFRAPTEDRA